MCWAGRADFIVTLNRRNSRAFRSTVHVGVRCGRKPYSYRAGHRIAWRGWSTSWVFGPRRQTMLQARNSSIKSAQASGCSSYQAAHAVTGSWRKIPLHSRSGQRRREAHACEIVAVEKLFPSKFAKRKSRDACLFPATLASRTPPSPASGW
jgi:hypothetical protein